MSEEVDCFPFEEGRLSRRGARLFRWPLEYLAMIMATHEVQPRLSGRARLELVVSLLPELPAMYLDACGRALNPGIVSGRIYNGLNNNEMHRYASLIPDAVKLVKAKLAETQPTETIDAVHS